MKIDLKNSDRMYIIAEVASTHEGDVDYLLKLVKAISETGSDAIKFQIFRANEIMDKDHPEFATLLSYELAEEAWARVIRFAHECGLDVWVDLSCDFGRKIIEANKELISGVKLHSSDLARIEIVNYVNSTLFPVILSCGGTTVMEIIETLNYLSKNDRQIVLMHGFQSYPTAIEDSNILRIETLRATFPSFLIGIADHLEGGDEFALYLPLLAVGAGARVIEKHITLNREEKRDDYCSSLVPKEFAEMVSLLRSSQKALGKKDFEFGKKERTYRKEMKKSVIALRKIEKGEKLRSSDIKSARVKQPAREVSSFYQISTLPLSQSVRPGEIINHGMLKHNIGIFVNARLHSTRLPRKALKPFYKDLTTIEYLLKRLKSYPALPGKIVFATSTEAEDEPLIECAKKIGVDYLRGSPLDVMKRMLEVAEYYHFDTLVRVTGDDLFVSAEYIEKALDFHFRNNLEFTRVSGLAFGAECEIIDIHALALIHPHVANKNLTEYLTWFLDLSGICKTDVLEADENDSRPHYRLTLDYEEDYILMKDLAEKCHAKTDQFYIPLDLINEYLDHSSLTVPHTEKWQKLKREDIDVSLHYTF